MSTIDINLDTPIRRTARVEQIGTMFDLPIEAKLHFNAQVTADFDSQDWNIGLVTGPSGSGKSSLARQLWPEALAARPEWGHDAALVDGFNPDLGIRDVTGLLSAVGLASPPAWIRPHHTLSNGEAFRADVARSLAESGDELCVIDEFTSVVDRQVAQVASHAIQKAVRRANHQFVAVTCHYDVVDWLQPDWFIDMRDQSFSWRSVQPHPQLKLDIHPASKAEWPMFARHHYLGAELAGSAKGFIAWLGDEPVGWASYRHFPHATTRNLKMGNRVVVMPDYQGIGIAGHMVNWLGQYLWDREYRFRISAAHPVMVRILRTSPRWKECGRNSNKLHGASKHKHLKQGHSQIRTLNMRSFEYVAPR